MGQYKAGLYLKEIYHIFDDEANQKKFRLLMQHLSVFDASFNQKEASPGTGEPLAAVAANILTRGIPTTASAFIHDTFRKVFRQTNNWSALYLTENPETEKLKEQLIKALHIVDPRITKNFQTREFQQNWDRFGHEHREEFLYHLVPEYLGPQFLQLLEQDMPLHTLMEYARTPEPNAEKYMQGKIRDKIASELDLSMEFPYPVNEKNGLIFEVRDARKEKLEQRNIDSLRDDAIKAAGWIKPYRYRTTDFTRINKKFKELVPVTESDFFTSISENYNHPLYKSQEGLHALQLALAPVAIARIQRIMLGYIHNGDLPTDQAKWHIGVIERDVPAAVLAIHDMQNTLRHLLYLRDGSRKLPEIQLDVFRTPEFAEAALTQHATSTSELLDHRSLSIEKFSEHTSYDVLLDVSVLQRKAVRTDPPKNNAKHVAKIRSIHNIQKHHQFATDSRITYNHTEDEQAKESLTYFVANLFGKKTFMPGQLELLQGILQQKNMLGILPPHGGKSIVQQLATLLQPAPSISIIPSSHVAVDQELEQNDQAIQMADRFSIINQSPEERRRIRHRFLNKQVLMLYAFAGNFQNKHFRELLAESAKAFDQTGYAFIDEVHCLSEWSHDFRPPYFFLAQNIHSYMRGKDDQGPTILGLTSAASYTAMYDIMRALNITKQQVIDKSEISGNLKYNFNKVKNNDVFFNTPINKAIEKTGLRKQFQLVQLLEEWYSTPAETKKQQGKTLIVCPDQSGLTGIEDSEKQKGIDSKLRNHFKHLTIKAFTGSYENMNHQASILTTEKSLKNIADARLKNAQIILSTEDMAIGINTPGIHNIIYLNAPASVEKFIQINGRAIRQKREGNIFVLYNDQLVQYDDQTFNNLLAYSNQEDKFNTTPDQFINLRFFSRYFTSLPKEMAITHELLEEITFPEDRAEDLIAEAIASEYGVDVSLNYHPSDNPYQLYVNHANKTFGYIDYRSYSTITDNATLDVQLGTKILNFAKKEIERLMPESENVFKWLRQSIHQNAIPGIEKIFDKITENEEASLSVHFRNKYLTHITKLLREEISQVFSEKQVRNIYQTASDQEDFVHQLEKINSFDKLRDEKESFTKRIITYYNRVRERQDTFAAIRRLVTIGVIDDFTVDFHSRMFNLVISPKSAKTYMVKLRNYLAHYLSPNEAERVFNDFDDYEGNTALQKAVWKLTSFIYDRMVPYHLNGIKRMNQLPVVAGSEEEQQNNIDVYLRFHNRAFYANPFIKPNLRADTNDLEEEKYKVILKYFKEVGDFKENWQHLAYSATILLREAPANYALKILHAYANMLLYQENQDVFFKAYDNLSQGAIRMYNIDNIGYQDFMTKLNIIVKKLYEKDAGLQKSVDPILNIKIHNEWLKNFNKHFLEGYAEKYQQVY